MVMKRKRLKAWHVALGGALLFGIGGLAVSTYVNRRARQAVDAALVRIKALGFASEFSQVEASVPDELNAAVLYHQAFEQFDNLHIRRRSDFMSSSHEVDYALLKSHLSDCKPIVPLIIQGTQRPECKFQVFKGPTTPYVYDPLNELAVLQPVLTCSARVASHEADYVLAQDHLMKNVRMLCQLRQPSLNALLMRERITSSTLDEFDKELQEWGDRADFRALAGKTLDAMPPVPTVFSSCAFVTPATRQDFANLRTYNDRLSSPPLFSSPLGSYAVRFEAVRMAALAKVLNHFADALTTMKKDPQDWKLANRTLADMNLKMELDTSLTGRLANSFGQVLEGIGSTIGRIKARTCLSRTALELYAIKGKTGTFPEALPSPVVDPLSGKNLIYRREGPGFRLYSAGLNGIDDGGKQSYPKHSDDVEFAGYWRR